ncbi:MAG: tetratricopeptide repeat protein [Xenococcaceae cyanobacterium MO_188.B29]|nr:tetratricopeptide repeat protein [Xenococcaceae cyanobacterium MO_188.B29]
MPNSEDIARFKTYVDEGIQLTKEGKLDSAIEKFCEALQLEPNSISVLNYLAGIYEIKKEFAQSITYYKQIIQLQPDKGITYARLAKVIMAQKNIQEAIAVYQQATSLQLKLPAWGYAGLGNALHLNRQLDEAIAAYQQAIELKSDNHSFYIELSRLYYQQGKIDEASESLQQAIKLKPDLPFQIYRELEELLRLQGRKKEATQWLKSAPLDPDGATYLSIWSALNQTSLESLNQKNSTYPKKINQQKAKKYFNQTSQYKTINLTKLKKKERQLIESLGWSLTYLESNRSGLISKEAISQEEYDSHLAQLQRKERREYIRLSAATQFQLSMVEDGFIQAICPSTGRNLTSNHSVYWSPRLCFCWYRFVGEEVFYLITGDHWREKLALYFPSSEVIVTLVSSQIIKAEDINLFKAYAVKDWERVVSYTICSDKKEKVTIIWFRHFAHHLWNELSAIYKLYETNSLDKVDKFLVVNEPLGCINEIFPEIPSEKIKHITHKELQTEILENNYFILNLGNTFIKEDLAKRVYQASLHRCSPAFLAEVESAKKNHSLLFWVSIRLGSRTWVSQVEGIANIIKSLSGNFPNLGVVIDGFSLPEDPEGFIDPKHKATIDKEKETVRQIRSLLPPEIKVYDTVGCWLYESIVWAYAIDLYLTHHGTIQHKVGWTANKPGVVHTNREILKMPPSVRPGCWERENIVLPIYISEQHIVDVEDKVYTHHGKWGKKTSLYNYECDWKGVYEEVLKIALSIRDEKIKVDLNIENQFKKKVTVTPPSNDGAFLRSLLKSAVVATTGGTPATRYLGNPPNATSRCGDRCSPVKVAQALKETKSNSMSNNLVIVIGRGNSGTRLIAYTLYASGIYLGEKLNSAGDKVPPNPIYQACKVMAKYVQWNGDLSWDFSQLFTAEIPDEFKQLVQEYIADILKFPKNRIKGWKLPETTLIYPWIVRMFPDAKYIHWVRDPRDCIMSKHLTDKIGKFGIKAPDTDDIREKRAISWYYQYQLMKTTPPPKNLILIRYEDFVLKQEETLLRLEEFLEVPLARVIVRKDAIGRWKTDRDRHFFSFFKPALIENKYELASVVSQESFDQGTPVSTDRVVSWQCNSDLEQVKKTEGIATYENQKEIEPNPNSIPALSKLAEICSNQKEYDKAFTYYLKIISLQPNKPIFLQNLVRASLDYSQLLLKKNDLERAIATYQEFIRQKPAKNNKTEARIDRICQIWGEVILKLSIRQGQWTPAITFFQEAIDNYPHQEWSYYYLGSILAKQDKLNEAIACYEKAVVIRPKFPLGLLSLGKLLLKTTRRDRAFECGLEILENHSIFGGHKLNKSLIQLLSAHSNPKKSQLALQQAIKQIEISDSNPDFKATTYSNIGMILRNQEQLDKAKDLYQKSIYYQLQESKSEFVKSYWEQGILQKPDFLVLGFAKCGTTAFYDYLCQHPQVLPAVKKEPMYLYHWLVKLEDFEARDWSLPSPEKDLYLAHFAPRPEGNHFITGEASTNNIFSGCEHVIHSWFPKIKLIVLLREPVRRTISYYEYRLKGGEQNRSLEEVINSELEKLEKISNPAQTVPEILKSKSWEEHVAMSLYVYPLKRWMNIFPREQFLILTNEELAQYPAETMKQAFDFLGLPECNDIEYHPRNVGSYPQADANLLSRLSNFFQPHNQRLEEFLGRKLDWDYK